MSGADKAPGEVAADGSGMALDLLVDVAFLMQSKWEPEHRAVVEASFHAMRSWPTEKRMQAMGMRTFADQAHQALVLLLSLHEALPLTFETYSVCGSCAGAPEWPCATARIIQEVLDAQ